MSLNEKEIESIKKAYIDYPEILELLLNDTNKAKQIIYDFDLLNVNGSSESPNYSPMNPNRKTSSTKLKPTKTNRSKFLSIFWRNKK